MHMNLPAESQGADNSAAVQLTTYTSGDVFTTMSLCPWYPYAQSCGVSSAHLQALMKYVHVHTHIHVYTVNGIK